MSATVIPFPSRRPKVFIDPVDVDGGSWGIFRQDIGDAPFLVTTRFAFDMAEKVAREMAEWIEGEYLGDPAPEPLGAA